MRGRAVLRSLGGRRLAMAKNQTSVAEAVQADCMEKFSRNHVPLIGWKILSC